MRLNMKILGQFGSQSSNSVTSPQIKEDKPTYREQFVPPEMSMVSYFLNKVSSRSIMSNSMKNQRDRSLQIVSLLLIH